MLTPLTGLDSSHLNLLLTAVGPSPVTVFPVTMSQLKLEPTRASIESGDPFKSFAFTLEDSGEQIVGKV